MYERISSLRFIETQLSPLLPIFAAQRQFLAFLSQLNGELECRGDISQAVARDFAVTLDSLEARVQSFESYTKFLLARVNSTIQMVSSHSCPSI